MAALKRSSPDTPTVPETEPKFGKLDEPAPQPIKVLSPNWRKTMWSKLSGRFEASKSLFGGTSGYFNYDGQPFTFTSPWVKLAHDPSVWDDEKNARFGKKGDDGKVKPLDANRKQDKWSMPVVVEDDFADWLEESLAYATADIILKNKDRIGHAAIKKATDCKSILMLYEPIVKNDDKLQKRTWNLDVRSERGARTLPVVVIDYNTQLPLSPSDLGQNSEISVVVGCSSAYINKTVKIYSEPKKVFVRKLVAPRSNANYEPELDD